MEETVRILWTRRLVLDPWSMLSVGIETEVRSQYVVDSVTVPLPFLDNSTANDSVRVTSWPYFTER